MSAAHTPDLTVTRRLRFNHDATAEFSIDPHQILTIVSGEKGNLEVCNRLSNGD